MLYGVIIPQKKGFLLGDTGNTYTQNKVLPQDEYFQPNTTYYKISGYEADGREKYKAEGYTVGEKISETTYTVNGQILNTWYEGQNVVGNDYYYNLNLKISFSSCRFRGIEDRLPNMRSGICYVYNSIIDNQEYYEHRNNISGLKDQMKKANSKFKLALVSQCIVPCFNAGVYYDNVKIVGVQDLVKNNNILFEGKYDKDGNPMDQYDYSGYMFKQCYFLNDLDFKNSKRVTGSTSYDSTTDTVVDPFVSYNKTTAYASPKYFNYHNDNNELDFEIIGYCNDYLPKSKFKDDETYIQEPEKLLYTMEKNYFNVYNSGTTSELYENFFLDIDYR